MPGILSNDSRLNSLSTTPAAAAAIAVASRTETQHVTFSVRLVQVVHGQAAALAQHVRSLGIHYELDFVVFYDQVVILWLIQSHSYARAASAKALDEEPDTLAVMLCPVEAAESFAGAVAEGDKIRVAHDDVPFSGSEPGARTCRRDPLPGCGPQSEGPIESHIHPLLSDQIKYNL